MLSETVVADLGVIERAEVDLPSGSIALTGETGAGKTDARERLEETAG